MACRILEGEAVGALSVDGKIQLHNVVNKGALQRLGLAVWEALLAKADRVIEWREALS
jgi:ABC-type uncharacterized transport system substrate-binding protein